MPIANRLSFDRLDFDFKVDIDILLFGKKTDYFDSVFQSGLRKFK